MALTISPGRWGKTTAKLNLRLQRFCIPFPTTGSCNQTECLKIQARKKSTKINFLGPETARWGGGLPREGVVAENFVPALETLSSLGFEERNPGCPGNFAGMSRTPGGVQKVCAKKLRAHFSFPKNSGRLCAQRISQKRKISPKTEVFGRTSLRTSGRKLRSGPPNPGKTSILARTCRADVHEKTSV